MTLVVGFSPGKDDWSSVQLGATLARSAGTDLLIVTVVPTVWPTPVAGHTDREFEDWAQQQGAAAVAEASSILAADCPEVAAQPWVATATGMCDECSSQSPVAPGCTRP